MPSLPSSCISVPPPDKSHPAPPGPLLCQDREETLRSLQTLLISGEGQKQELRPLSSSLMEKGRLSTIAGDISHHGKNKENSHPTTSPMEDDDCITTNHTAPSTHHHHSYCYQNYGTGPLFLSDIPKSCCLHQDNHGHEEEKKKETKGKEEKQGRRQGVVVGIDEAGRGPVCGPMVYSAVFWNHNITSVQDTIPTKYFQDSKQLSIEIRSELFQQITKHDDIGYCIRILSAPEISRNMFQYPNSYNLNQMSHDAAKQMIQQIISSGIMIDECYIDTVGNPNSYRQQMEQCFPNIHFIVESKADSKYPSCSAASIVAKVVRDSMISNLQLSSSEQQQQYSGLTPSTTIEMNFGSGYPSDPICKKWMDDTNHYDTVFGLPDVVRYSWAPTKNAIEKHCIPVMFVADMDTNSTTTSEEESQYIIGMKRQREQMNAFLGRTQQQQQATEAETTSSKHTQQHLKRLPYFTTRKLQVVMKLP